MTASSALPYRKDIDGLRAVAVMLVVIFHGFPTVLPGGFIGVDVFFVISGYLITSIIYSELKSDRFRFLRFYERRVRRLFPALATVLIGALILGGLFMFPSEFEVLGEDIAFASVFLLNFRFMSEIGYFDTEHIFKPLLHLWTLSVEEQYYLAWPIVLVLAERFRLNLKVVLGSILVLSFLSNLYFVYIFKEATYLNTGTRIWELAAGSLLALSGVEPKRENRTWATLALLGVIVATSILISQATYFPGWVGVFPIISTVLIIRRRNPGLLENDLLVALGKMSYPFYLWHWLLLAFVHLYFGARPSPVWIASALATSFVVSWFTYRYIEIIRFDRRSGVPIALVAIMLVVGSLGYAIKSNSGFPTRGSFDYLAEYEDQFTRTARHDTTCDEYVVAILGEKREFQYCRAEGLQSPGGVVIVLGDSHAHALFAGVAAVARSKGMGTLLLANSSCPPMLGIVTGANEKTRVRCRKMIEQIDAVVSRAPRGSRLVFATRGPVYIQGEGFGDVEAHNDWATLIVREDRTDKDFESKADSEFGRGVSRTMTSLAGMGLEVVYLLDNPELGFSPRRCIPRPHFGVSSGKCWIARSIYDERMGSYRELISRIREGSPNFEVFDPEPLICDTSRCFGIRNGKILYADDDHYSVYGAGVVAAALFDYAAW